jgi:hypothetical protein
MHGYNRELLVRLPKKVKVVWWFFGHELYSKRLDLMLSKQTIKAVGHDYKVDKKDSFKNYYLFLKRSYVNVLSWNKLRKRINCILVTSKEEYSFMKRHWFFLPKLILFPFWISTEYIQREKKNFVILGNNRNMSNNHLDVLDILQNTKNKNPYKVKMFLSYGIKKNYYKILESKITQTPNVESLNDYLSIDNFGKVYEESAALVLNCYRQMGLANIIIAIENNCKLYLNDKNPVKKWLQNEGLFVFSIKDFERDYEVNALKLTEKQARYNIVQVKKLIEKNNYTVFQQKIIEILKSN